jgi:hypothetical protein
MFEAVDAFGTQLEGMLASAAVYGSFLAFIVMVLAVFMKIDGWRHGNDFGFSHHRREWRDDAGYDCTKAGDE